ncbi:hypothetical protein NBO_613g0001 [Nosema bombycis CQ1]|uniref:Uncharacterized protein n=1 Tax=Nosema bombycis (strain CQ1 / CVCC 102059) TaxID=578461 RepID=R0M1R6_NOSB1|nr:hypothetical protein NBO_613g0001 [Nosema bombycis CQ1]|eukprot:EOB11959.1 hypothetical protein NBO_613g0001 [Nosema bombycis CQ1]
MNFKNSLIITIYYVMVLAVEETTMETGPQGDTNEKQSFVSRNKERFKQGLGNLSAKSKENLIKLKNKAAENLSIYNKKLKELTGKAKEDMIKKREETMKKIDQYNKKLKEFGGRTKENIRKFGTKVFGKSGKKQAENKTKQENEETEYLEPI